MITMTNKPILSKQKQYELERNERYRDDIFEFVDWLDKRHEEILKSGGFY